MAPFPVTSSGSCTPMYIHFINVVNKPQKSLHWLLILAISSYRKIHNEYLTTILVSSFTSSTLVIDIGKIYCFGTGLQMLMPKDEYQYRHFKENSVCKLTSLKPQSREIVQFYLMFL